LAEYINALDGFLAMGGKLIENFSIDNLFSDLETTDAIQFEDLYDELSKWAVSPANTELAYEDFAQAEEKPNTK